MWLHCVQPAYARHPNPLQPMRSIPSNCYMSLGTEVPVPGGAVEALNTVAVTRWEAAERTLFVHREAFQAAQLGSAWGRVIALVVQPGVEFDHGCVVDYKPARAVDLELIRK